MSVPPLKSRPSWRDCYEAGMTLPEACRARVVTTTAGRGWARKCDVTWPQGRPADRRPANMIRLQPRRET